MVQTRVARGVPSGGQYSFATHAESTLTLFDGITTDVDTWQGRLTRLGSIRQEVDDCLSRDDTVIKYGSVPVHDPDVRAANEREAEQRVIEAGNIIDAEIADRVGPPPADASDEENEAWLEAQAGAAREILSELREFGDRTPQGHPFHDWANKAAIKDFSDAMEYFPADWVERSATGIPMIAKKTRARAHFVDERIIAKRRTEPGDPQTTAQRIFDSSPEYIQAEIERIKKIGKIRAYSPSGNMTTRKILDVESDEEGKFLRITYSGGRKVVGRQLTRAAEITTDGTARCSVHELSHRMEATNPRLLAMEHRFYQRRTWDDELGGPERTVAYRGRGSERVRPDGFVDPYVGKEYLSRRIGTGRPDDYEAFEVMSVGMESVFAGSHGGLAGAGCPQRDLDHRAFVLGALAVI